MATGKANTFADDSESAQDAKPQAKTKIIKVKSLLPAKPDGGHPVALWEKNPAHPGGEAFVAGDKPVEVATTAEVNRLIRDNILEEVA